MHSGEDNGGIYVEKQVRVPTYSMTYDHSHTYCEIFYLKTGSCIYYVNNDMYHLIAGDVFIVAPGDSHSTSYEGLVACERIVVCCELEAIPESFLNSHEDLKESLQRSGKVVLVKKGQLQLEGILSRMMEENNFPDEYSYELMTYYAQELFLCLKRGGVFIYEKHKSRESYSADIEDAIRYIAQNYALSITLEDVAKIINLSPTYLSKKFKKVTGMTFKEYVNYIRLKQASQALLTTDNSITEIAVDCGFNSSNYFKDLFRKVNGVSPRTFRKQSKTYLFQQYGLAEPEKNSLL